MSAYTKGVKNAGIIGDFLANGEVVASSVTFANTASSTATLSHGLSAAPDWVLFSVSASEAIVGYSANSTAITFTRTATTTSGAGRIDVLAGTKA